MIDLVIVTKGSEGNAFDRSMMLLCCVGRETFCLVFRCVTVYRSVSYVVVHKGLCVVLFVKEGNFTPTAITSCFAVVSSTSFSKLRARNWCWKFWD